MNQVKMRNTCCATAKDRKPLSANLLITACTLSSISEELWHSARICIIQAWVKQPILNYNIWHKKQRIRIRNLFRSTLTDPKPSPISINVCNSCSLEHWIKWKEMHFRNICTCLKQNHTNELKEQGSKWTASVMNHLPDTY